ncbi:helix-turn-helix transcriptional regulator [Mycobacterium marinum]|uniref:helix-turn-helix transcriptional regulator n=1 Tax=Mycobacterium marinum TaxID=1781 RepID=UPI0021C2F1E9|nr:LuxR family transcriptional regulator [Mycobacterium marinum]
MRINSWPIVQRNAELAAIREALVAQATRAHGIVLAGDAGVGKTTLAREVTRSLSNRVKWVAGTESARALPMGAFAHLVAETAGRDPMAYLASVRKSLLAQPHTVVAVDDAQLLDGLSAMLLHQLVLDGDVRIVATVRTGAPAPDAVTSLWKDGYLPRIVLGPFSKEQCVELIEEALGGQVEELSIDAMYAASGGNALFVRHLVEGVLEAGTLRQVRGVWQLRGRTVVSPELATLLDARVDQAAENVTHVLHLLTFCEPLDLDTMVTTVGGDAVEQAESAGLIRVVEDGGGCNVWFTHPLFADVMRRRLGVVAARRVRGELVRALQDKPIRGPAERIRLAELVRNSDVAPDVKLLVAAARDAIALTNLTLGEQLARAAVDCDGGFTASLLLARALAWQGKAAEAEKCLSSFDPDTMDDDQLLRWGIARLIDLRLAMDDAARASEVLELLRTRVGQQWSRLVVDGLSAAFLSFNNRLAEAADLARRVIADSAAPPGAVWSAFIGGALALGLMGRGSDIAALAERAHAIPTPADRVIRSLMAVSEVQSLLLQGDFDAAEELSAAMVQVALPGQYLAWGLANVMAGMVGHARGRFADVVSRMKQTIAALSSESAAWWSFPQLILAQSYCVLGRATAAATLIGESRTRSGSYDAVYRPQLRIAEAWLAAAEGAPSVAIATALDAADLAHQGGQVAIEMLALHDAVRFGDRTVLQRLIDVTGKVDGQLAAGYAAHASGLLRRDAAAVMSAAERFEQIGALLSAADAAAQAAAMFAARGDRRRAIESSATADRIAMECGGIQTPALLLAAQPLPLSTREREVASLVAQGLTTRQIAEQLSVSARTVEGHIYRACTKLGLSDREELATLIDRATTTAKSRHRT